MAAETPLKPRKNPRQRRSRFTVEQILEAAAQVFSERGRSGATTNHIAERAGVSIGSVYQYFPNKDAILVALAGQHIKTALETLEKLVREAVLHTDDVESLLNRFVTTIFEMHAADPGLHHVLLFDAPRTAEADAELHRIEDAMAEGVSRLLSSRMGVSVRHSQHAAYMIVHIVENMVHEYQVHPPKDLDREAFVQEMVALLSAYVRGPCAGVATC